MPNPEGAGNDAGARDADAPRPRRATAVARSLAASDLARLLDRRAARGAVDDQLLRALIDASPLAIWVLDLDGNVLLWNPSAERLTGWTADEVLGRPLPTVEGEKREEFRTLLAQVSAGRPLVDAELDRRRRDGSMVTWSLSAAPIQDQSGRTIAVAAMAADITERRRAEAAARELAAAQAAREATAGQRLLADAGALLASSLDPEAMLAAVAKLVVPTLADWLSIQLLDAAGTLRPAVTMHADPEKLEWAREYQRRYPSDGPGARGSAVVARTGRSELHPVVTDEMLRAAARDEDHLRLIRALGMTSVIIVPLVARERPFGAMSLVAGESGRRYGEHDLRLAEELARRIAVAIDNARLFIEARAAADRTARLQAVTAGLARALSVEDVADTVVHEGVAAFRAREGILCLTSDDGRWLEIVRAVGLRDETVRDFRRFPVGGPFPLSDAVRTREPLFLESRADLRARYPALREANERATTEAWIALPVLSGGAVLGGLAFGFVEAKAFTPEDRGLGVALAQQCAQALERTRLLAAERAAREEAERAADRTARLQTVTAALAAAVTTEDVATAMLDHGLAAVGAVGGVVCRLNDTATEIDRVWALGYPAEGLEGFQRIALTAPLPPRDVVQTRAPVFVESPAQWLARYLPPGPGMTSAPAAAGLPLLVGDRLLGVMVLRFPEPRGFSPADRTQILSVASQCAQALERARLHESERAARARADEANRAKSEFLATMSHELRTPLNAIGGYVQLLEMELHGPVTAQQREALARVSRAQERLLGLINDVLNFARLESGRVEYDLGPTPVADVMAEVAALMEPQLSARALALDVRVPEHAGAAPILVQADREKLAQVLLNLLSNAVKFTPQGGRIALEAAPRADDPPTVEVRVTDTGIGIPPDKLQTIFEPFVQLGRGRTSTVEGTGLGLAISRDLVRGMGGELTARSTPGAGSVFTLALPQARPE